MLTFQEQREKRLSTILGKYNSQKTLRFVKDEHLNFPREVSLIFTVLHDPSKRVNSLSGFEMWDLKDYSTRVFGTRILEVGVITVK